jgi:hypothetical protein
MRGHHLDGRRKSRGDESHQGIEGQSNLLTRGIDSIRVLIRRPHNRPLIGQQRAGDGKENNQEADQGPRAQMHPEEYPSHVATPLPTAAADCGKCR